MANKPPAWQRIEHDIANGDLGKARDRLHGLLSTYPNNLKIRRKLGDIYYQLQDPAMAGRYWYLEEEKTPEMTAACEKFERAHGQDPKYMLRALKYNGNHKKIDDLRNEAGEENTPADWLFLIGCLTVLALILTVLGIGIYTIFQWIF
ncbi:DUF6584 family protein [Fictibacillus aquaticus]|uniref:Uncharacterized protein n=1 Tax=Fictibacillus aquaticus TaxID=2021314 RepID=A0A235F8K9_9BACL|nr:DUF6584 family protein [Fictibacillus aquaticus]OYD57582.1 hypothetical protein CGZ90_13010 [Fictibacillus aquaticus]